MTKARSSLIPLTLLFVSLIAGLGLFVLSIRLFQRTQSGDGTRSGVVVKLSYKGRLNRSWEGELMLGSVQSGQTWAFSLNPADANTPTLAASLQAAELSAAPVTLRYHQRFIWPWLTDTNYLVVEEISGRRQSLPLEPPK